MMTVITNYADGTHTECRANSFRMYETYFEFEDVFGNDHFIPLHNVHEIEVEHDQ